jgi:hypothetical protein
MQKLIFTLECIIFQGAGITEGHMQKLIFTLECMNEKYQDMQKRMINLETTRTLTLAGLIKEKYPDLARPDYEPKGKKKVGKTIICQRLPF